MVSASDGGLRPEPRAKGLSTARNRIVLIAFVIVATAILATSYKGFEKAVVPNSGFFLDFSNCYCTASVAKAGSNPYRAEPMGACIRDLVPGPDRHNEPVIPAATLPGFVIPGFAVLTYFDYGQAAFIWLAILVYTFVAIALLTANVTGVPIATCALAFLPLGLVIPIELGQIVTPVVALLLASAVSVRHGYHHMAGTLAGLALYEPHIALPVCIAMFTAIPRTRPALITLAGLAATVSFVFLGWHANLEYVMSVIPAQMVAEAAYNDQYSLTYLLTWAHVPTSAAVFLGKLSYAVILVLCYVLARFISTKRLDRALLMLVPMAASVLFGPYVHVEHLLAAVPGALLLIALSPPRWRYAAIAICIAIALPAKTLMQIFGLLPPMRLADSGSYASLDTTGTIGQLVWQQMAAPNTGNLAYLLAKIPTWCSLIALLVGFILVLSRFSLSGNTRAVSLVSKRP